MWPYFSGIGTQHSRLYFKDPTKHTLVASARREFVSAHAIRRTTAPPRTAPNPTFAFKHCIEAALHPFYIKMVTSYLAAVCIRFLVNASPESIMAIDSASVVLRRSSADLTFHIFIFGDSGVVPRVPIQIPTNGDSDPIRRLFSRVSNFYIFEHTLSSSLHPTSATPRTRPSELLPHSPDFVGS